MTKKRKNTQPTAPEPGKRRRGKKRRIAGIIVLSAVLLAAILAGAAGIYVKSKLDKIRYADDTASPSPGAAEPVPAGPEEIDVSGLEHVEQNPIPEGEVTSQEDVMNILLLGTDYRFNASDRGRADAVLILSLDFRDNSARLVSLERGMGMPILSGNLAGNWDWLTHLCSYGGPELVLESVRECFKLDVERYVTVDVMAFAQVVDALGGVDVELTDREAWALNSQEDAAGYLSAGVNHLSGYDALRFARLRRIDSDWVRIQRQRRVLQACADQVRNADLKTLNDLADAILPLVGTNFTQTEILALLTRAPDFLGVQFEQMTIPAEGTYGGMSVMGGRGAFAADFAENTRILQEFLYGGNAADETE